MELIDALQEVSMQEPDSAQWMSLQYRDILVNQETIRAEFKARTKSMEYLSGILIDLFVDWHKLKGIDTKNRVPEIQQAIMSNNLETLLEVFNKAPKNGPSGMHDSGWGHKK